MKRSIFPTLLWLISELQIFGFEGFGEATYTNDYGCVVKCSIEKQVFTTGNPVLVSIEFQNTGIANFLFQHIEYAIVNGFRLRREDSDTPCSLTEYGEKKINDQRFRNAWNNPLWLIPGESMKWSCYINNYFDMSVSDDYSLDMDIPFLIRIPNPNGTKGETKQNFHITNIVFRITEPTNAIISYTPPHEDLW